MSACQHVKTLLPFGQRGLQVGGRERGRAADRSQARPTTNIAMSLRTRVVQSPQGTVHST